MAQAVAAVALVGCGNGQTQSGARDAASVDASAEHRIEGGFNLDGSMPSPTPDAGTPVAAPGACVQTPEADCSQGAELALASAWNACKVGCSGECGGFAVRVDGQGCAVAVGTPYPGSDFESCIVKELAQKRWSCAAGQLVSVEIACTAPPC